MFIQLVKYTYRNLLIRKGRSFLTILGIIIGVASVISIMAVGAGAENLLLASINKIGSTGIAIFPGAAEENGPPASALGIQITTLTLNDALAIEKIPHITGVSPQVTGRGTVSANNKIKSYNYVGVLPSYLGTDNSKTALGRFFRSDEADALARVAVIGSQVKDELFGSVNPIDQRIKINQTSYKIIGLMEKRGSVFFQNQDNQIFIPLKTAQKIMLGIGYVNFIGAKVDSEENIDEAVSRIKDALNFRHNIKDQRKADFSVRTTAQALSILGAITQAIKIFLTLVAAISLLVGGIGIMNIMFVSVNERVREIGLRKSLGAKRKNILIQFLMESVFLTLLGGIIGIILGVLISLVITIGANAFGYEWKLIITPASVLISVFVSTIIGLVFGLWPANRASKLNPIAALRTE